MNRLASHFGAANVIRKNRPLTHDGSSSYQRLPGIFHAVCQNRLICCETFWEVRVSPKVDVKINRAL